MERKSLSGGLEIKDAEKGIVSAAFSTMGVRDHDGDYTREDAFTDGAAVVISAYGHKSWDGAPPVGKGVIRVKGKKAVLEGQFFMNTTAGRDTFETVKELAADGLGEWSYGFDIDQHSFGKEKDQPVRYLEALTVHEVSPVLRGAGINTRTLSTKGRAVEDDQNRAVKAGSAVRGPIPPRETATLVCAWDGTKAVADLPEDVRPSQLRTVFAWVDPDADPELKSSYLFAHHHGVDGPANIRACLQSIAQLNGANGDSGVPEKDREAVYKHLAAHLTDADREPPQLRTADGDEKGRKRFADEASDVMANLSSLNDRAAEVMALRAQKGKGMSAGSADLLSWIRDEVKRLETLLSIPVDDAEPIEPSADEKASLFVQSLALINDF
ncbi:HK97 family phage prohead protease [Streptomyces sp. NBC_00687]|uniref:HK97 family phage prohead protease n=1 Tax=Streptomyces sp. NBC_00687 TaxID=2975807 RepID=UPI00225296C5|nr:HK97 family phage prohead protease [Streptomyces sp. NBC_00687]MCX4912814.1 HK97 family phage prohead protease [Streptomyces sp. NBC_00687]